MGTNRRAVCLQVPEIGYFVGPDNGLFSYVLVDQPNLLAREITNPALMRHPVSMTFHGRDIFAPTAAHLSKGYPFEKLGPLLDRYSLVQFSELRPQWQATPKGDLKVEGKIAHIDYFGNLITNLPAALFQDLIPEQFTKARIEVEGSYFYVPFRPTYGTGSPNEVIALFSSSGYLEIARVNGRADINSYSTQYGTGQTIRGRLGQPVTVTIPHSD